MKKKLLVIGKTMYLISERLYNELIYKTNRKEYSEAKFIVRSVINECSREVENVQSANGMKIDFEI